MPIRVRHRLLRLAAAPVMVGALWLVTQAQEQTGPGAGGAQDRTPARYVAARTLVQPVAPPAIDRGLQDTAPLPQPRRTATRTPRGRRAVPFEPGKVIVRLREGGSPAERAEVMRASRGRSITRPSYANFDVVTLDPRDDPEAVADLLRARPDVEYAQAAYRVHPYFRPNDPFYGRQWNLPLINLEQAWDINRGSSSSMVVAVLDTGIAFENAIFEFTAGAFVGEEGFYPALGTVEVPFAAAPELGAASRFEAPFDFIWDDADPVDMDGHGTHVSGTLASLTDNGVGVAGVAFNVRVMPVKCITSDWDDIFGSPYLGTDDVVARAIRYAADNGAKVINMSLGRNEGPEAPVVGDAMRYAVSRGAFIAVAAGNAYDEGNPVERLAEQAGPIEGAIVVAAVGPDRNRAFYSGVHSYVEIAAPGGNGRLTDGGVLQQTYDAAFSETFLLPPEEYGAPRFDVFRYRSFQGTSMATPHVSGLAALLMSQGIASPAAVEAALKRFAEDRGTAGRDDEYGFGIVDARRTLRGLGIIR